MNNKFVHGRLETEKPEDMKGFYGAVFSSWTFKDETINNTDYILINTGNNPDKKLVKGDANMWIPFVAVSDVTSTLDKVKDKGGTIVKNRTQFGDYGFYGLFKDPQGALLGIWEEK